MSHNTTRRRSVKLLTAVATVGLVGVTAACGSTGSGGSGAGGSGGGSAGGSGGGSKVTVRFMEAMASGALKPALQAQAEAFEKANPNITIDLQPYADYGTLANKLKAATSAGKPPTIAQVYPDDAATYASSKVIVPLDSFSGEAKSEGTFYKGIQKDLKLSDGKTWMWPFAKSTVLMYYNPDMLKAAGQQVPKTWDQFATVAKAVSKNGVTALSIDPGSSSAPAGGTALFEILCQAYGTPAWTTDGKPQFDSPAAVKALTYLSDLKKNGALAIGSNYPGQIALGAKKGTFDISSVASYFYNKQAVGKKFTMQTAGVPKGPAGNANQLAGGNVVMFAKASKAQQDAAWKFLQFLTTPRQQATWSTASGYLPVTAQALPLMKSFLAKNPYQKTAAEALQWALDTPPYASVTETQGDLAVGLQAALGSGKDPSAALKAAQSNAEKHMKAGQ
jgi:multiple sugar transport system substrate-binding protein